jgi:hypothetical protein
MIVRPWLRTVLTGILMAAALCSGIGYAQKSLLKRDEWQDRWDSCQDRQDGRADHQDFIHKSVARLGGWR